MENFNFENTNKDLTIEEDGQLGIDFEKEQKERAKIISRCVLKDPSKLIKDEDGKWYIFSSNNIKMTVNDYYDLYVSSYDPGDPKNMYHNQFPEKNTKRGPLMPPINPYK